MNAPKRPLGEHPLAPLLNAALGVDSEGVQDYVDTVPMPESIAVVCGGVPPDDWGNPLYLYREGPDVLGSNTTRLHYQIPMALAVVLYKLQQVAQGVSGEESWQDVLDHLCLPRVWGEDVGRELPPANRLALASPQYFRLAQSLHAMGVQQLQ